MSWNKIQGLDGEGLPHVKGPKGKDKEPAPGAIAAWRLCFMMLGVCFSHYIIFLDHINQYTNTIRTCLSSQSNTPLDTYRCFVCLFLFLQSLYFGA